VSCPKCTNAFEVYANAARFKSPEMTCRICGKADYMVPLVQDVRYEAAKQLYFAVVTVRCRHCWLLAWLFGLFNPLFRLVVKEVELSLPGVKVKAGAEGAESA
jgi:hypothetical protein